MKGTVWLYGNAEENDVPAAGYPCCKEINIIGTVLNFVDAHGVRHITTCRWEVLCDHADKAQP